MIRVEELERVLKYVLASAKVKNAKPLSAMFIANPECGKTSIINRYCLKTDGILYTTDATAYGIIMASNSLRDIEDGKITHIVVPDLTSCLARKESTIKTFIGFMNALIEEGIVNIATYATNLVRQRPNESRKAVVKCGFVTAITPTEFKRHKKQWDGIGFLSRMLPVTYNYSMTTQIEIMNFIKEEKFLAEVLEKLKLPKVYKTITLPKTIADEIEKYSIALSQKANLYGFRIQKQLQVLAKAIALCNGNDSVKENDMIEFKKCMEYINFDYKSI